MPALLKSSAPIRTLVVDDSAFFRKIICRVLESDPQLEVVGQAVNGKDAVEKAEQLRPDIITMDVEMPVMDGISAVREIMRRRPTSILMLSSHTSAGAAATLQALDAGALDFVAKRAGNAAPNANDEFFVSLINRVKALARKAPVPARRTTPAATIQPTQVRPRRAVSRPSIVIIGASTGGPAALTPILQQLPTRPSVPIVVAVHMPAAFTGCFAERLNSLCDVRVVEATHGCSLDSGTVYIAPGGMQTRLSRPSGRQQLEVEAPAAGEIYRPCIDITLRSAVDKFGASCLAIILTGMGEDGLKGSQALHRMGGTLWAQDEDSCVVYGMPMAVADAGVVSEIIPLGRIGRALAETV